jgi:hypothetical protein
MRCRTFQQATARYRVVHETPMPDERTAKNDAEQ